MLARTISSVGTGSAVVRFWCSIRSMSMPTAAVATRSKYWCTVVSGGRKSAESYMSSKPTTLTEPGTSRPASCSARMAPSAIASLDAKIAVTAGSVASRFPAA